ncbi:hypothetical protein SeLEV6574_g07262 [Synchytrium endobioticum]|uniref:Mitochondrial distribution and morphology protein 35 n=1 Tax=Synchytrium endobioticum TaxID=286115 RepID=A0A507CLH7_9FUNG|nr:hypothetical protein SeLEV6574_g07262 [Synchytrium endobioticum]
MGSLAPECTTLKHDYDACFNKWYSEKFLKGIKGGDCEELFRKYKECVWEAIKDKGIDKLIQDARKESPIEAKGL